MSWQPLHNEADCEQLDDVFGGFHDACLREMHVWTGHFVSDDLSMRVDPGLDNQARLLFQRQFKDPSAIELCFEEITELRLTPTDDNFDSIIERAYLTYDRGLFTFSAERKMIVVAARKLSWRDTSTWMGPELRYGADDQ